VVGSFAGLWSAPSGPAEGATLSQGRKTRRSGNRHTCMVAMEAASAKLQRTLPEVLLSLASFCM
jgi:hypothetical protein